jgi:hypothetical protein
MRDVGTGKNTVIINDERASELNWLEVHDLFLYLHSGDENKVDLTVGDATNLGVPLI